MSAQSQNQAHEASLLAARAEGLARELGVLPGGHPTPAPRSAYEARDLKVAQLVIQAANLLNNAAADLMVEPSADWL